MPTPASVLADLLSADPARPRLTCYDDVPGPSAGERIELSAKVLANWVAKAGNALQEELDVAPGSVVSLALPVHWRAVYWAMAVWSVGATLDLDGDTGAQVVVTDDPERRADGEIVLVTLPALARSHPAPLPPGVMDEARDLATYGDRLDAWESPGAGAIALVAGGERIAYEAVVPDRGWPRSSRVHVTGSLDAALRSVLAAWAVDGSVVLTRGDVGAVLPDRLRSEAVTLQA